MLRVLETVVLVVLEAAAAVLEVAAAAVALDAAAAALEVAAAALEVAAARAISAYWSFEKACAEQEPTLGHSSMIPLASLFSLSTSRLRTQVSPTSSPPPTAACVSLRSPTAPSLSNSCSRYSAMWRIASATCRWRKPSAFTAMGPLLLVVVERLSELVVGRWMKTPSANYGLGAGLLLTVSAALLGRWASKTSTCTTSSRMSSLRLQQSTGALRA